MAVALGKRKRHEGAPKKIVCDPKDCHSEDDAEARALFQKAFEAKFKPLEVLPVRGTESSEDSSSDEECGSDQSDWDGISEGEDEVEIVEHTKLDMDAILNRLKAGKKSFMSSRPPTAEEEKKLVLKPTKPRAADDSSTEVANLKKDIALQRLLKESHLLDVSSFSAQPRAQGKDRLKALDIRLQDLGAKPSLIRQEKMPMSMRKGISTKAAGREAARRKEAAENGIILEKFKRQAKSQKHRARGVTGPGIGKMYGSTLRLSARDVRSINRPPSGAGRKGRKK